MWPLLLHRYLQTYSELQSFKIGLNPEDCDFMSQTAVFNHDPMDVLVIQKMTTFSTNCRFSELQCFLWQYIHTPCFNCTQTENCSGSLVSSCVNRGEAEIPCLCSLKHWLFPKHFVCFHCNINFLTPFKVTFCNLT